METTFEASMPGTPLGVRMVRHEMTAMAAGCGMDADGVADVQTYSSIDDVAVIEGVY